MPGGLTAAEQAAVWDRRGALLGAYPAEPDAPLVERLRLIPAKLRQALDVGCGHGRHLLLLASMGWRVTGLDWSPARWRSPGSVWRKRGGTATWCAATSATCPSTRRASI